MNILLVCVGGMSSSLLMDKMRKYAADHNEELRIDAVGEMGHAYERCTRIMTWSFLHRRQGIAKKMS